VRAAHDSMMAAVAACKPGVRFRDLGDIISKHVSNAGCVAAEQGEGQGGAKAGEEQQGGKGGGRRGERGGGGVCC
jgi:methionine aminopeptidase